MIRYKVTRQDRTSCIIYRYCPFCKSYKKGETITAQPKTLGIFTFKTKKQAEYFKATHCSTGGYWQIIKVEAIGRGKTPKTIAYITDTGYLRDFYKGINITRIIPKGTICYPAVKVLD